MTFSTPVHYTALDPGAAFRSPSLRLRRGYPPMYHQPDFEINRLRHS